jgi:hypothetical protein
MGFSENPQELFFNFEFLLSDKTLDEFESAKANVLSDDDPTVVQSHNAVTKWKHCRGFRPFQAESGYDEMKKSIPTTIHQYFHEPP